eukprot:34340-Eustigmatos_ZCMA.PRE.1
MLAGKNCASSFLYSRLCKRLGAALGFGVVEVCESIKGVCVSWLTGDGTMCNGGMSSLLPGDGA